MSDESAVTIILLLILGALGGYLVAGNQPVSSLYNTVAGGGASANILGGLGKTGTTELTTMAWLYPGEPSCNAAAEYRDGRQIDILKPEYFTIDQNAELILLTEAEHGCNAYSAANIADLKKYSREQYATVSLADAAVLKTFLKKALSSKDTSIATLVTFAEENEITGIEIDFEDFGSWDHETYTDYKAFVTKLGNALHREDKKLMIDGPAISNSEEERDWFVWRYADFVDLPVDTIVVMAYDYQYDHGSGEPVAPIAWIQNVIDFTLLRFPDTSRLTIGIPSYGYEGIQDSQELRLLTREQIAEISGSLSAERDPASYERVWRSGENVYYFQDEESMTRKLEAIRERGINSVSVWHLGGNAWFRTE